MRRADRLRPVLADHARDVAELTSMAQVVLSGRPTEVSVAVVDRRTRCGWVRGAPTVQVEGGSYSLPEVRRLSLAIDELLRALEVRQVGPPGGAG